MAKYEYEDLTPFDDNIKEINKYPSFFQENFVPLSHYEKAYYYLLREEFSAEELAEIERYRQGVDNLIKVLIRRARAKKTKQACSLETPQAEKLTAQEQREESRYLTEESSLTTRRVYDMITIAYSHLRNGDYASARKQVEILRAVDLPRYLDGDEEAQKTARKAISELEKELGFGKRN